MSKKKFKKEKEKKEKKEKGSVRSSVLYLLEETAGRAYSPDQLGKRLGLKKKVLIKEVYFILDQLEEEGLIEQRKL
jgi:Fe2+ or Zn2+ uptake regulation protein